MALLLDIKLNSLTYLLFKKDKSENYQEFTVPKKAGGVRRISAPTANLKDLQRRLATLLARCIEEIEVALEYPNTVSHGFMPGRSIFTNANLHRNKRFVFNVDLEDFFSSITFPRIRGFLMKDRSFALHEDVATVLAQIACHDSRLPQGSPCSPIISNLIGQILDLHLVKLAKRNGCTYTRYADDITFSTNKKIFPSAIAVQVEDHQWDVGQELLGLIRKSDFKLNLAKTRMQYKNSRQQVTGLVTNKKVNIRSEYRRHVRAMVHRLLTTGQYFVQEPEFSSVGVKVSGEVPGTLNQLHGRLGFIYSVDKYNWSLVNKHPSNYPGLRWPSKGKYVGNISTYQRFLLYTLLYNNPRPLIVCEGKTDNVYLTRAMHSLHATFPTLTRIDDAGKRVLVPRLFKYPESSTGEVLGTESGGAANLAGLLTLYSKEVRRMTAPPGTSPVIFVVDNDRGPREKFFPEIRNRFRLTITGDEPFIHVFGNVYLVITPKVNGRESCMEDFFTAKDKAIVLNGKSFDPKSDGETDTTYSKATFAYKVVAERDDIDFNQFTQLLSSIAAVITAHSSPPAQ